MKRNRQIPTFKTEAEEADWWFRNRAELDQDFVASAKTGPVQRLDPATLKAKLAASSRS